MNKLTIAPCVLAVTIMATAGYAEVDIPKSDELAKIVETASATELPDYQTWVASLSDRPDAQQAIRKLADGAAISDDELILLARLLGVWTRATSEKPALELLQEAVSIQTFLDAEIPNNYENPEFIKFGELIERIAADFDLAFRNVDGQIFEVALDGPSDDVFGILTHADVVPADAANWTLTDGTKLEPYEMQIIGNNIYGRGTIDDKGSIITALFAMRAIKQSGLPLARDIRLMIETTEETSGSGMEHYMESNDVPDYNIVLDSDYPAIIAEKGYGTIDAYFPLTEIASSNFVKGIEGGTATNQIPDKAVATIATDAPGDLVGKLDGLKDDYVAGPGGDFQISATEVEGDAVLTVKGVSAHASEPEAGLNPLPRLMQILSESNIDLADNHWIVASEYIDTLFGADYLGEKIGLAYSDDFMGPLTLSPTFTEIDEEKGARVAVNIRAPRGMSKEELKTALQEKIDAWNADAGADATFEITTTDWMYRDPDGKWLNALLNIFGETTGLEAKPLSSAGSTTAKLLPNAINFGPNMPGDKYMGHNANEFKRLDAFQYDLQMFTEMMVRISNLDSME